MQYFLLNVLAAVLWGAFVIATYQFVYRFNIFRNKNERVRRNGVMSLMLIIAMILLFIGGLLLARPHLFGSAVAIFILMTCFALFIGGVMGVSAYRADYRGERVSDEMAHVS